MVKFIAIVKEHYLRVNLSRLILLMQLIFLRRIFFLIVLSAEGPKQVERPDDSGEDETDYGKIRYNKIGLRGSR